MKNLTCKTYLSDDITDPLIDRLVDMYRTIFINSYFKSFLVYPSSLELINVTDYFKSKKTIGLEQLDHITDFPCHPTTGEQAVFRYNKHTMQALFKQRLTQQAVLVTLEDSAQHIGGFVFGYQTTPAQAMQSEEWQNPILYSGYAQNEPTQNIDTLLNALNKGLDQNRSHYPDQSWKNAQLNPDSKVMIYGAIGIHPKIQKIEHFYRLNKAFFKVACQRHKGLMLIGESKKNSTGEAIYRSSCGVLPVEGFFKPSGGDLSRLLLASLDGLKDITQTSLEDYVQRIRANHPSRVAA